MTIQNLFEVGASCLTAEGERFTRDGRKENASLTLACEQELELFVNGELAVKLYCTPDSLSELCTGWLISEGYIEDISELASLYIDKSGRRAIAETGKHVSREIRPLPAKPVITADTVFKLLGIFEQSTELYDRTHGVHECVLAKDGYSCAFSDIGRYNAFDKAVGSMLIKGLTAEGAAVFSSGRVSGHMIKKVARCGVTVLISKASASTAAIEAARHYNICLVLNAKGDSFFKPF